MSLTQFLSAAKEHWPLRTLRQKRYARFFYGADDVNAFMGVYPDFKSATNSLPKNVDLGYDHQAPAKMYRERLGKLHSTDYPVLFWLKDIAATASVVMDFGGHVGVGYYAYYPRLSWPDNVRWHNFDVPAVVNVGRELAKEKEAKNLYFSVDLQDASDADVFLASGSLQYFEKSLPTMLGDLHALPKHVLFNMLPLRDVGDVVTLQNIGTAICPYKIFDAPSFFEGMQKLGYERIDLWDNPKKSCVIPFFPKHSVHGYYGGYFRRKS